MNPLENHPAIVEAREALEQEHGPFLTSQAEEVDRIIAAAASKVCEPYQDMLIKAYKYVLLYEEHARTATMKYEAQRVADEIQGILESRSPEEVRIGIEGQMAGPDCHAP